jgi:tetraacyldisaccharide 4'-kinase
MWREFSDHHLYSAVELDSLAKEAGAHNADLIVCTQKDLVKAPREKLGSVPLWAVAIDIQFLAGREALEQILEQAVRKK